MTRKNTAKANKLERNLNQYTIYTNSLEHPNITILASDVNIDSELLVFTDEDGNEVAAFKDWRYFEKL